MSFNTYSVKQQCLELIFEPKAPTYIIICILIFFKLKTNS